LQEEIPHLGDMDTGVLAELNTLGEIIELANASAPSTSSAAPQTTPAVSAQDFEAMLLEVVAEKTGYPKEMLTLDMELESGLGIDSIKRVEILSSLQDQIPHLGEMDTGVLAELNTLGEIIELANASAPERVPNSQETAADSQVSAADFEAMLLAVVAEKTGYPEEMLTLDMELESGLGIDSIKRVEILSSLQDQIPHLGEMDTGVLAELNTLGEIIDLANASAPGGASEVSEKAISVESVIEMTRYEVSTEDRAASGIAIGQIHSAAPLHLVGDKSGIAEKLATLLGEVGITTQISDDAPKDASWLVVLSGLTQTKNIKDQAAINVEAFEQVRRSAAHMSTSGRLLVTVQATGGDFGMAGKSMNAAWATGLAALAKTASREWPNVAVKAIDVDSENMSEERVAQEIFGELIAGGPEQEVGLMADGSRITLVANDVEYSGEARPLSDDSVIVVSGGARGVTAACLQELLNRKPVKLAILGRTPLKEEAANLAAFSTDAELKKALLAQYTSVGKKVTPIELNREVSSILNMREVRSNLQALSASGSEVIYLPTDITDAASVDKSVSKAREQLGPITMIVHAAGVLADKEIHKKTDEQFQSVFKTKVAGLQNLLKSTATDPLTHMVCFSSVAARTGNSGQVDYAMANDILNRVCQAEQQKRGAQFIAKSIGWGPWAGGMVDPSLAGHFRAQGVELIPMDEGAVLFADEVEGRNGDCVEIVYGGGLYNAHKDDGNYQLGLHVHVSRYPQISSHLIKGQAVVPLVLVNEWGSSIAAALYPAMNVVGVRDLNVVKGIQLDDFEGQGNWLNIVCSLNDTGDLLGMTVSSNQGVTQYQLSIELSHEFKKEAELDSSEALELENWEWTPKHIYDELLFHGEKLQVIKKLLGASEAGCRGMLQMPDEADLARFRVAMLDGGLQLALLWERKRSGLASLPTKLGHLTWNMPTPIEGPVLCDLILKKATKLASTWSIVFTNVEKQIIATMEDVNIHVLLGKA
ncbi:MAG: SDR family oxidoreductase, partial [Pseudomonadales bacterium]|nr:SDR family oxidoreductase [Pseudomonadales bacterium]